MGCKNAERVQRETTVRRHRLFVLMNTGKNPIAKASLGFRSGDSNERS